MTPSEAASHGLKLNEDGRRRSFAQLLAHPDIAFDTLKKVWPEVALWSDEVRGAD